MVLFGVKVDYIFNLLSEIFANLAILESGYR